MSKLCAIALLVVSCAAQATDVGVSIGISQPGVYGRIDIGRFPQPALVVAQPVVVHRPQLVYAAPPQPVPMWVPPGHRKHWHKHCARYGACGVPVVFVQDAWYQQHVAPAPRAYGQAPSAGHRHHRHGHGDGNGHGKGKGRGLD